MKTDRELLELAARAAGIRHIDYTNTDYDGRYGLVTCNVYGYHGPEFDPLNNDGDALRLSVKLGLCITQYPIYAEPKHSVLVKRPQLRDDERERIEEIAVYDSDPYAATRRTIVRAAAAIGEGMK